MSSLEAQSSEPVVELAVARWTVADVPALDRQASGLQDVDDTCRDTLGRVEHDVVSEAVRFEVPLALEPRKLELRTRLIDARSIRHLDARQEKPIAVLDL